ncbi:fibroblast growth factor-binding protein 2 [Lampris incognitus]|uniref:fibroblast growth factor-binding protein 2 n=1 Tax=Lampris incognitus TaxID=2546036 RepID=UPI0024B5BCAE|nr:fibroblast growth factor-binding protein 2 [Lampris incognitus]
MSTPGWAIFFLLFCLPALAEAKRQSGEANPTKPHKPPPSPQPARRPHNRSVPGSGTLTTKEGHRCTWETSGQGQVSLLVSCSVHSEGEQQRYWCRYAGKPDQCQAYSAKSSQYWKQLVGKLKKRHNACEGEKILKAKTCKKAPAEAHMKLAQRSGEETAAERKGGQAGGKRREPSDGGEAARKKKEVEEEKRKRDEGTGFVEDGVVNDMDPVQSYCAEGWHSVCSFFVKFFEG